MLSQTDRDFYRLKFIDDFHGICKSKGDEIAITYYKVKGRVEECSFRELENRVMNLMEEYEKRGLKRGDRVAVLIPLSTNAYIDILALACMGCTSVILDIKLSEAELIRLIEEADVSLCVTTSEIYNNSLKNLKIPVVDSSDECIWLNQSMIVHATDPDYEAISILYSSGTTSRAKGVVIGYEQEMKAMDRLLEVVGTKDMA